MKNIAYSFLTAFLLAGTAYAAEPSSGAPARAALYQDEVRTALVRHGWQITQEGTGKITAERIRVQTKTTGIVTSPDSTAQLLISFRADDEHHTTAAARASLLVRPINSSEANFLIYPPLALRDPALTREYREILAEAETGLAAKRHAFAAKDTHHSSVNDDLTRVAMK